MSTRIRKARSAATLSQAELARRVGVERSAATQWERPNGTTPSVKHLARIATETGFCFEWLATGRGPSKAEPGAYDVAVVMEDYARDAIESRVLTAFRRFGVRKRETIVQVIELLSE